MTEKADSIIRQVLLVGPQYKNHRGGIGGLLAVYARYLHPFHFVPTYRPFRTKFWYLPYFGLNYVRLIARLFFDRRLRIVHIHGAADGSFYRKYLIFLAAKKLFRRQVVFHVHSSFFIRFYRDSAPWVQRRIREVVEESDALVCLSESWREQFEATFRAPHLVVLGNVVEPPAGSTEATPPETILSGASRQPARPLHLLFLGLIGDNKGIFDLLKALADHRTELSGRLRLTVGGNGEVARLKQFITDHHLEDMVTFAGWITGERKERLLREADVFVLPSHNEGLPMSILEAMSFGLPVLSTPVGGIPEAVTDGRNGYLVRPGDSQALYDRIRRLLEEPGQAERMGRESADMVRRFYPEQIFAELRELYAGLLSHESSHALYSKELS